MQGGWLGDGGDERFAEVIALIEAARARGYQAVNTVLVEHYWDLGAYISGKIATAEWGDSVVKELAADLAERRDTARAERHHERQEVQDGPEAKQI